MARIDAVPRDDLAKYEDYFKMVDGRMGFLPSSLRTMAKHPPLLESFSALAGTIFGMGEIDGGFAQLIANMASNAAGCRYCQAHTGAHAAHEGVDPAKVAAVWEFETSDLFTEAERSALRLARDGAQTPNAVTDAHFAELRQHYTEPQIMQIVATMSLFGFLNRWNDTVGTTLEDKPTAFASEHLAPQGWEAGHHGPTA